MNIFNIEYAQPAHIQSVANVSAKLGIEKSQAIIFEKIFGLKDLPLQVDITADALASEAINKCLNNATISKATVKWIIHAHTGNTITPYGDSIVRKLQQKYDFRNAMCFGMCLNKCASVFKALEVSQQLFEDMTDSEHILIVAADITFTEVLQFIPGTTIMTDGSCAILLKKNDVKDALLSSGFLVKGEFSAGIWGDAIVQYNFELNYVSNLARVIVEAVARAKLSMSDISYVFPHNVNTVSWKRVAKHLNLPQEKFYLNNIAKSAHCFGSDPFINLKDAQAQALLKPGDFYVLATVGLGATYSAMVFRH